MRGSIGQNVRVWASTLVLALGLLAGLNACGGGGDTRSTGKAAAEDFDAKASDFHNLHTMTKVRGFFIDNRRGHLDEALAVANAPNGGTYPVGTIIQLLPQEAMIKRRKGFNPTTKDWEFFSLEVSSRGTVIKVRGKDVVNRFAMNCAACHSAADPKFDFVCEETHGCAPLPIGPEIFRLLQQADPRPQ